MMKYCLGESISAGGNMDKLKTQRANQNTDRAQVFGPQLVTRHVAGLLGSAQQTFALFIQLQPPLLQTLIPLLKRGGEGGCLWRRSAWDRGSVLVRALRSHFQALELRRAFPTVLLQLGLLGRQPHHLQSQVHLLHGELGPQLQVREGRERITIAAAAAAEGEKDTRVRLSPSSGR